MPTLETPGRSVEVLIMMLLGFLSQALGLLKTSMGPYDGDDCCWENRIKAEMDFNYCTW